MDLDATKFEEFFSDVYGYPPFKWQKELAKKVCKSGWPESLDMPTAAGKTAVIDIAVFHLAMEAHKKNRKAPLRIIYVVDRRLVIDDVFERALKLANKISNSEKSVTKNIAMQLKSISSSNSPLDVVRLRGGMPRDNDWARTPSQPLIITSTVDQVGSRLLFRGYGVSKSMRPVHAGLLGSDVLYIIDEAHTSMPFVNTLRDIHEIRKSEWKSIVMKPFKIISMSATLPLESNNKFPLENLKKELLTYDKELKKRMNVHKYVELYKTKSNNEFIEKIVLESFEQVKKGNKKIGIVVNYVLLAREIFSKIKKKIQDEEMPYEIHLLTGRSRPFDRDQIINKNIEFIKAEKIENEELNKIIFYVATQCIEVGVDISFDTMITQIAPLDSLQQRFGRLNRLGKNRNNSNIMIIANETDLKRDYIYKDVSKKTWKYLIDLKKKNKKIDFGVFHFNKPKKSDWKKLKSPVPNSMKVLSTYIPFWTYTNPAPFPDPIPSLFLHGVESKSADVQVIWRADVNTKFEKYERTFISTPSSLESISLPIWTVKKWLSSNEATNIGDVEGMSAPNSKIDRKNNGIKCIRWCGRKNENTKIIDYVEIQAGDTIIVPATYGKCDEYGWGDNITNPVTDIGIESNLINKQRITLRFNKHIVGVQYWKNIENLTLKYSEEDNIEEFLNELLNAEGCPELWKNMIQVLKDEKLIDKKILDVETIEEGGQPKITGLECKKRLNKSQLKKIFENIERFQKMYERLSNDNSETHTEDYNNYNTKQIKLLEHSIGVKNFVKQFCEQIGIDEKIAGDVELAALLHDSGKAEKRVQAFLRGKNPHELPDTVIEKNLLAKSICTIKNKEDYEKYRKKAQLPKHYRHECWSVSLVHNYSKFKKINDQNLVSYLIGTHHGYGRPLFPPVNGMQGEFLFCGTKSSKDNIASPDSIWIDIISNINKKYDPWEIAYLESILRLADHRQSEMESNC